MCPHDHPQRHARRDGPLKHSQSNQRQRAGSLRPFGVSRATAPAPAGRNFRFFQMRHRHNPWPVTCRRDAARTVDLKGHPVQGYWLHRSRAGRTWGAGRADGQMINQNRAAADSRQRLRSPPACRGCWPPGLQNAQPACSRVAAISRPSRAATRTGRLCLRSPPPARCCGEGHHGDNARATPPPSARRARHRVQGDGRPTAFVGLYVQAAFGAACQRDKPAGVGAHIFMPDQVADSGIGEVLVLVERLA